MGVAAGALLTLLVQSSSATVGLTIALGTQGLLPLDAAIPIVLGDNIGTCITAVLASIGTTRAAQQACTAHVLFNVIGVCIFLPLMPLYIGLIAATSQSIGHQIANAHTLFNVCNTLLFLPFVRPFAALIRFLLPDRKAEAGAVADTLYLDPRLIEVTPVMAVEAVRNQCAFMGDLLRTQLDEVERMVFENNAAAKKAVISLENRLDAVLQAMERYSEAVLNTHVSDDAAHRLHALLVCAGDLERIGDRNWGVLCQAVPWRTCGICSLKPAPAWIALWKASARRTPTGWPLFRTRRRPRPKTFGTRKGGCASNIWSASTAARAMGKPGCCILKSSAISNVWLTAPGK